MTKQRVVRTKYKKKTMTVDEIVDNLIMWSELAMGAIAYLEKQKKLTMPIKYRLEIEANFCLKFVFGICKIKNSRVAEIRAAIHSDEKRWEKQMVLFCETIVGPGVDKKVRLYGDEDLKQEVMQDERRRKADRDMKEGSGRIVPGGSILKP